MKDMTKGNPARLLLQFFLPVCLGNIFQQFYTIIDTMLVGKFIGVHALAGVGSTGAVNYLILGFLSGCASGFGVVISQSFGSKDYRLMRRHIMGTIYLSVIITILFTAFTTIFCGDILKWMDTPADIWREAYDYIFIIFAGIAASMLYNLTASVLRAVGDSRTPFIALIFAAFLNIVLDIVFIRIFHMGTAGAALATVVSQAFSGIACLLYMWKKYEFLRVQKSECRVTLHQIRELLAQGIPMALQMSITAIGSIVLQVAINGLGAVYVAAISTGFKIQGIVIMIFDGLGVAVSTYCSQNAGAKRYDRIVEGIRSCYMIQLICCTFSFFLIFFAGKYMALLFIDPSETEVMKNIIIFLRINAFALPFSATLATFRYGLQGMGYSFLAMFAGAAEMIGRILTAYAFIALWGYAGACMQNLAAWSFADIFLIISYIRIRRKPPYNTIKLTEKGD